MEAYSGNICFIIITLFILGSALAATFSRSITTSVFSLFFLLFGIAGYYVFLNSDFLTVSLILIYAGSIAVLFIFCILLTNHSHNLSILSLKKRNLFGALSIILFFSIVWPIINSKKWADNIRTDTPAIGSVNEIGNALITDWVFNFTLVGIVLLIVLIASAYITGLPKTK